MQPEPDHEVGYKKPPKDGRYKKGQSGNLRGRPRGSKNVATLLRQAMVEIITVSENGRRRRLSRCEIMMKQLASGAAQGDPKATQTVLRLMSECGPREPEDRLDVILNELHNVIIVPQEPPSSTSEPKSDHEIGDNKPPEDTPIKQRRRRARSQAPKTVSALLWGALGEKITMNENGRRRRISKLEAMFKQLANRATEGDPKATQTMLRLLSEEQRRAAEAAKNPKLASPRYVVMLPHNNRDPIRQDRLERQNEYFALIEERKRKTTRNSVGP